MTYVVGLLILLALSIIFICVYFYCKKRAFQKKLESSTFIRSEIGKWKVYNEYGSFIKYPTYDIWLSKEGKYFLHAQGYDAKDHQLYRYMQREVLILNQQRNEKNN